MLLVSVVTHSCRTTTLPSSRTSRTSRVRLLCRSMEIDHCTGHTLREWVSMESTQREIYRRFRNFLKGNNVHAERIKTMCENNGESLVIRSACMAGLQAPSHI